VGWQSQPLREGMRQETPDTKGSARF